REAIKERRLDDSRSDVYGGADRRVESFRPFDRDPGRPDRPGSRRAAPAYHALQLPLSRRAPAAGRSSLGLPGNLRRGGSPRTGSMRRATLIEELHKTHLEKQGAIRARLAEFEAVMRAGDDERLFEELVFCIFTAGASARMGLNSIERVRPHLFKAGR